MGQSTLAVTFEVVEQATGRISSESFESLRTFKRVQCYARLNLPPPPFLYIWSQHFSIISEIQLAQNFYLDLRNRNHA